MTEGMIELYLLTLLLLAFFVVLTYRMWDREEARLQELKERPFTWDGYERRKASRSPVRAYAQDQG